MGGEKKKDLGEIDEEFDDCSYVDFGQRRSDRCFLDRFDGGQEGRLQLVLMGHIQGREKREENVENLTQSHVIASQRMEEEDDQPRKYHCRFDPE